MFDAIGQALPTPPVETIEEVHVSTSMYDASMGSASGAHIETTTKSGTNDLMGKFMNIFRTTRSMLSPPFLPIRSLRARPRCTGTCLGSTIGGPIKKNKLFFFGSYQGQRIAMPSAERLTAFQPFQA